jgi:Ca2+-binding RTX toxin-like protein
MANRSPARRRRAFTLIAAAAVAAFAPAAAVEAQVLPPTGIDTTVGEPSVTIGDVSVLGPTTARVQGSVDPVTGATSAYFRYGEGTVLSQRTPDVTLTAGAQPSEVLADLLDLKPGSSYSVQLVTNTPAGAVTSRTVSFTTPAEVFVDPRTGAVVASTAKKRTRCTIVGTAKRDRLVGTRKRDVICALGGNDRVLGRGGNDLILAGGGHDRASGGAGSDRLYGNAGSDRLYGNGGRDRLYGGNGADRLNTASNRRRGDLVHGGKGRDRAWINKGDRVRSIERVARR